MPKPVGRKIGFTNRSIWPKYGVYQPVWGTVYDSTLSRAQAGRCEVSLRHLRNPRIEPEICFGMKHTPRNADIPGLLEAIDWIAHSIEIVQCERADWKVTLADCAPQNAFHGHLVLGRQVPMRPEWVEQLPGVSVVLLKNEREVERGAGANVLDSPLLALSHLVSLLPEKLQAGELVSTGTMTDAHPVAPGETWRTRLEGLPLEGLTLSFR
jgi:2-oxo-3-hexenedioate decarboxylase